ncbi:MAG: putative molybdenum carrier protein [Acidobacteriota bacterium]|nr:putative molybdenum carrier protein [Acidobacteriota bacterium]
MKLTTIVSGGQTGVDRAALDVASARGFATGGWVPIGRTAEDGVVPARYTGLREAGSPSPAVRTALNVRDSDATLIVARGPLTGGSRLTLDEARRRRRPVLHLDLALLDRDAAVTRLRRWLREVDPVVLNVAGPRASRDPRIGAEAAEVLAAALDPQTAPD